MPIFDPETYLNATTTESASTSMEPCPEGDFSATVKSADIKTWESKKTGTSGIKLSLVWDIDDQAVKESLGRTSLTCRQEFFLDLTDSGTIDYGKGKNISLGRLRDALGLNESGQPFAFSMLPGRAAMVHVQHHLDGENIYDEVKRVARL